MLPWKAERMCCVLSVLQMDYLRPGFVVPADGLNSTLGLRCLLVTQLFVYFSALHVVDITEWLNMKHIYLLQEIVINVFSFEFRWKKSEIFGEPVGEGLYSLSCYQQHWSAERSALLWGWRISAVFSNPEQCLISGDEQCSGLCFTSWEQRGLAVLSVVLQKARTSDLYWDAPACRAVCWCSTWSDSS